MCQRTVCRDCGKFTWTGCGLHITEVLAGLPLEQICSCDDDQDSEHSWATLTNQSLSSTSAAITSPQLSRNSPGSVSPLSTLGSSLSASASYPISGIVPTKTREDPSKHCVDPSPIEYKLSKISANLAEAAVSRKAQQADALEELKRIKMMKDLEFKEASEKAFNKLVQGLSETSDSAD
ncbi:hypothetical protein BGZ49_007540 [Haplosporangium sp. Z 27]|nr:hypothetical protein BGZ49_007540 [Haplosporangium sp. Z 27]